MPPAVVFPGQGSQQAGAGRDWLDHSAWSVVERAEAALDVPLAPLLLDLDADLSRTRDSQLSVLLSLVAWEAARDVVGRPVAFAGHSLGQITALIASGAVGVRRRRADGCGTSRGDAARRRRPPRRHARPPRRRRRPGRGRLHSRPKARPGRPA